MIINQLEKKQKIIIISTVIIFVIIFILLFFIQPTNKYSDEISIKNYDKYISNLPKDKRDSINNSLYKIVKNNLNSNNLNVNDANIREGSNNYNYNEALNINSGSFMVDMQSIKQSYLVSYEWSSDTKNDNLSGYTTSITCLSSDKLIYGDFNCKDDSSLNTNRDPILNYLPYSRFNYVVTATMDNYKANLNVDIFLFLSDTENGERENSINKYKTEVIDWIKSINLNPDNYLIKYTINEN